MQESFTLTWKNHPMSIVVRFSHFLEPMNLYCTAVCANSCAAIEYLLQAGITPKKNGDIDTDITRNSVLC